MIPTPCMKCITPYASYVKGATHNVQYARFKVTLKAKAATPPDAPLSFSWSREGGKDAFLTSRWFFCSRRG